MKGAALAPGQRLALTKAALALLFGIAIVVLLMWLAGVFTSKIRRTSGGPAESPGRALGDEALVAAHLIRVPATESAVGTIRAVHETTVASKLLAKVMDVRVKAGQSVDKDEILVRLDDRDLQSRQEQAESAVRSAQASQEQAKIEYDRVKELYAQNSAARIELERADTTLKAASADLQRAEQAQQEATVTLGYATILSPLTGIVVDKRVEVGDMVTPGQTLLTLYDPKHMQLVASVRESLVRRLQVGQTLGVHVDALNRTCPGTVSEIVPESDVASRSFAVKVTGPCPPDIHSGMYGRLLIPLDEENLLVIPQAAVRRVGQLDMVDVADSSGQRVERRVVQLGRKVGEDIVVLAGLAEGERVALPKTTPTTERGA